jgi:hypothetical protein
MCREYVCRVQLESKCMPPVVEKQLIPGESTGEASKVRIGNETKKGYIPLRRRMSTSPSIWPPKSKSTTMP